MNGLLFVRGVLALLSEAWLCGGLVERGLVQLGHVYYHASKALQDAPGRVDVHLVLSIQWMNQI
jgi:hypothetical protein